MREVRERAEQHELERELAGEDDGEGDVRAPQRGAPRVARVERVEREVAKARGLIVDSEKKNSRASNSEEETRVLSRAVEGFRYS